MQRKGRAVLAAATHFAADADDLLDAGADIVGDVAIVLTAVRLGHEHLDVLADELGSVITEQALGGGVDVFDQSSIVNGDDGRNGQLQDAAELGRLRRRRGRLTWCLCHDGLPKLLQLAPDRVTTPVRAMATMRVGQVVN